MNTVEVPDNVISLVVPAVPLTKVCSAFLVRVVPEAVYTPVPISKLSPFSITYLTVSPSEMPPSEKS